MDTLNSRIIDDIRRVGQLLGRKQGECLSRSEYLGHGHFSMYHIYDGGHTWEAYCQAAGLSTRKKELVDDEVYLSRLVEAQKVLGRLPKSSERRKFGLNFSKRRFATLPAFIEYAASRGIVVGPPKTREKVVLSARQVLSERVDRRETVKPDGNIVAPIPALTIRKQWQRTGIFGFPYSPQDETGVIALFGILCAQGKTGWEIVELRGGKGIDAICYDHKTGKHIIVELKKTLSRGSWNHKIDELDYVVCWENRWPGFPKPVIVLSDLLE